MYEVVRGHPECAMDGWAVVNDGGLVACAVDEDVARVIVAARSGLPVATASQMAAFAAMAFNPHQQRGPDGKWIKMPTSELKRPRRAKKSRASKPAVESPKPVTPRAPDPGLSDRIGRMERQFRAMHGPNESRWPPEDRAALALARHEMSGRLDPDSKTPQVLIPDEFPNYREDRDRYNQAVIGHARNLQADLRAKGRADGSLQFYIDAAEESLRGGHDDYDAMVDLLRQQLDMDFGGRSSLPPPPAGGDVDRPPLAVLPPGQRTPGGQRPPLTDPYEARRQALDRSVRSGIVDQDEISDGIMGDTRRVILADGTEAIYKRAQSSWVSGWGIKEQTDAEELGALVAAAVGVRAPAIQRADDANLYMEVMPGTTGAARGLSPVPQQITDSPQGMRMGLLDVLLNNVDRHAGNWMIDLDNNIAAIDHGLAFKNPDTDRSQTVYNPFTGQFVSGEGEYNDSNPLTRRDIEQIRSDLERIRPRFEELGRADWLDQVEQRLDKLSNRVSGYRPLLEGAPTMFA